MAVNQPPNARRVTLLYMPPICAASSPSYTAQGTNSSGRGAGSRAPTGAGRPAPPVNNNGAGAPNRHSRRAIRAGAQAGALVVHPPAARTGQRPFANSATAAGHSRDQPGGTLNAMKTPQRVTATQPSGHYALEVG